MSDEQKANGSETGGWVMPDPVYRSTEGHTPKSALVRDAQNEPSEHETEDALSQNTASEDVPEPAKLKEAGITKRPKKKGGGCASAALSMLGMIVALVLIVVIVLAYFLFWYQPQDTSTF